MERRIAILDHHDAQPSFVLVRDAEIGHIPPTPTVPPSDDVVEQARKLLLKFGAHYGIPVGYAQEQNGRLIQHVLPNPKTEYSQMSSSSKTILKLHTETAFHPYKPDWIILMCLRGDENAFTTYALCSDILRDLDNGTIQELRKPQFFTTTDESFRRNGEKHRMIRLPILEEGSNGLELCYDDDLMTGENAVAERALRTLRYVVESKTREIALESGDVFIINNRKLVHGRKPFQPRYDGTDRWMLRLLLVEKLPPKSEMVNAPHPVINTDFGV
jgi:alpha-ketoglutarate-dependent taurine dioxygenase